MKDKGSESKNSLNNKVTILRESELFRGKLRSNLFDKKDYVMAEMPWPEKDATQGFPRLWSDYDLGQLRLVMENQFKQTGRDDITTALNIVFGENSFHPVREYLSTLPQWDKHPRLDTLFIDFLGADDTQLVRAMTRKEFCAAVARIFKAGTKFDYMIILMGEEGQGKSTLINKMAVNDDWFLDGLPDMKSDDAMTNLSGKWIIEVGELSAMKHTEVEVVKQFLSRKADTHRFKFNKYAEDCRRQCVLFGTTNDMNPLKGNDGNRRMWVIPTGKAKPTMSLMKDLTPEYRDQVWAEAVHRYKEGETLYLTKELEAEARMEQNQFNEVNGDPRRGMVETYLEMLLPDDWEWRSPAERLYYCSNYEKEFKRLSGTPIKFFKRNQVSAIEVLTECFGPRNDAKTNYITKDINTMLKGFADWESLGDKHKRKVKPYGKQRVYVRKGTDGKPTEYPNDNPTENQESAEDELPF